MKPFAEFVGKKLWVHINGKTFSYESQSQKKRRQSSGADEKEIFAPMPGKITAVMVNVGEAVKKEQVIVVMEAMKMEYTLKASVDGVVADIRCKPGAQVNAGDMLICLK